MNISWEWLEKLVDLKGINIESVTERLTLAGFEVENIIERPNHNKLLEISSTTNRSDTLSIMGIAKEISAITNRALTICGNNYPIHLSNQLLDINQNISNNLLETKIINLQINITPDWLQSILADYGIRSENNIIDIIRFIEIKWSKKLRFKNVPVPHTDPRQRHQNLYIYYNKSDNTYKSGQDHLHEVDLLRAYTECLLLITNIHSGIIETTYCYQSKHIFYKPLFLRSKTLQEILGPSFVGQQQLITDNCLIQKSIEILLRLDFISKQYVHDLALMVPFNRLDDVHREIDVVEEVSRVYGFDKFLDRLPFNFLKGAKKETTYRLRHIRSVLRSHGYHESIHSPLEDQRDHMISIYNPLIGEFSNLRGSLLNKLLNVNILNLKQGNGTINLFESSRVFVKNKQNHELIHIACIFGGDVENRRTWSENLLNLDWFQAKGQVETLFERLNIPISWSKYHDSLTITKHMSFLFYSNECAVLTIGAKTIGIFGGLKSSLYNTKGINTQLYGFELVLDDLIVPLCSAKVFTAYSKYPSIIRDITGTFESNIPVNTILKTILDNNNPIIESVKLVSLYENQKEGNKRRNLSFRIVYRSENTTLTNDVIDELESNLKRKLNTIFQGNL